MLCYIINFMIQFFLVNCMSFCDVFFVGSESEYFPLIVYRYECPSISYGLYALVFKFLRHWKEYYCSFGFSIVIMLSSSSSGPFTLSGLQLNYVLNSGRFFSGHFDGFVQSIFHRAFKLWQEPITLTGLLQLDVLACYRNCHQFVFVLFKEVEG